MKFHGVDMRGELIDQRVSALPDWTSADEGRLLYVQSEEALYYGTNTEWIPLYIFRTIVVSGQSNIVAEQGNDTLTIVAGSGITITTNATTDAITISTAANFGKIAVSGQTTIEASQVNDTITFATANSGLSITTTPATNTVTLTINYAGTEFPSTPVAGMLFYRTDTHDYYMRNYANTAWTRLFSEDYPPLDQRAGGTFSADMLDGYHYTTFGSALGTSGNYTTLLNPASGVISSITVPYATNAGNASLLEGYTYDELAYIYEPGTTVIASISGTDGGWPNGYAQVSNGDYSERYFTSWGAIFTTTMVKRGRVNAIAYMSAIREWGYLGYAYIAKNGVAVSPTATSYAYNDYESLSIDIDVVPGDVIALYVYRYWRAYYLQVRTITPTVEPETCTWSYVAPPPVIDGGGCCFTWDALVLTANKIWKRISDLVIGDKVINSNGDYNTVLGLHKVELGNHRKLYKFDDNTMFSNDHPFLIRKDGQEIWGTYDMEQVLRTPQYRKLYDNITKIEGAASYKHINGWKTQGASEVISSPDLDLYTPILDGDATMIVNGYVTFGIPAEDANG